MSSIERRLISETAKKSKFDVGLFHLTCGESVLGVFSKKQRSSIFSRHIEVINPVSVKPLFLEDVENGFDPKELIADGKIWTNFRGDICIVDMLPLQFLYGTINSCVISKANVTMMSTPHPLILEHYKSLLAPTPDSSKERPAASKDKDKKVVSISKHRNWNRKAPDDPSNPNPVA